MTTITREQFLQAAPQRYDTVHVEGFGVIGLRSVSEMQKSKRLAQRYAANGQMVPIQVATQDLYAIIDHVMIDESTPMFTDADLDLLGAMDSARLAPVFEAINAFNAAERELEKNEPSGSPTISVA